jgi:hypothetical protein
MIHDNPRLLPFCPCYREDIVLSIIVSEEQQETSPVLITYSDDIRQEDRSTMDALFVSLTNIILAYVELYEYREERTKTWREDI